MEASDKRLWTDWRRRGDEHAFEALVRPHMVFALDFARRMGCSPDQADDVLQTCLAHLAGAEDNRPVRVGIRAWIGRRVSLEARMLKRSEGRRARRERAWEPYVPEETSIDERMAAVERGIDELTPAQREAVWLRFRHDLDYSEIARILGASENACRLRVHKAMVALRQRLGRDAGSLVATLPLLSGAGRAGIVTSALAATAPVTVSALPLIATVLLVGMASAATWWTLQSAEDGDEGPAPTTTVAENPAPPRKVAPPATPAAADDREAVPPRVIAASDDDPRVPGPDVADAPSEVDPRQPAPPVARALHGPRRPILPVIKENPKAFRDLVEAARMYFDLDEEQWKGRTALMAELTKMAEQGHYFLRDLDALRWLVYEGRSFDPPLNDRKWQKSVGIQEAKKLGGTVQWIKAEELLTCAYSVPRDYWKLKDMRGKYPRPAPNPFLLTMHDKRDFAGQKYPADVLLKRRWPKKQWGELYEKWIVMGPVAAAGAFVDKGGMARDIVFKNPFAEFWRHYNIDFDRIVLDGGKQAFTAGTSMPVFFSGIILRGKWTLEDADREVVTNLAPVPLYVVQNPKLAKQLEEAGHKQVTAGIGGPTLMKWMNERKRVAPKEFTWVVQPNRFDMVLPYWINLDSPNWAAPKRELTVSVLDTEKDPNTIRIKAEGITTLSLFLNDDLVDLDRKLRVEVNGHVEYDKVVPLVDPLMKTVGRDFDFLFNRPPVRIRSSMFFGWLSPARIVSLNVRPPRKVVTPKGDEKKEAPKAKPEDIDRAGRFLQRAKIFAGKGNVKRALEQLAKVLELPETEHHAEARKLKQELAAKAANGR